MSFIECQPVQMVLPRRPCLPSCFVIFSMVFLLSAQPVFAHELRLGYLQLNEMAPDKYVVLWKVPARVNIQQLSLSVQFPDHCINLSAPVSSTVSNTHSQHWQINCAGGLANGVIGIVGLTEEFSDVLVRLENLDGTSQVARLVASAPTFVVPMAPNSLQVTTTYFKLGVEHILFGVDHLLFVFALLLIVNQRRRLVATITAFTVAHSITLAAATLGFVDVPPAPVEAAIALSIVFVAREIMRLQQAKPSLTARKPWLVAFVFGLLHGFGFAVALSEVGLPQIRIPTALLFFNLGVETGQLLFVAAVVVCLGMLKKLKPSAPCWARLAPSYAIGSVAMFWVFERISTF